MNQKPSSPALGQPSDSKATLDEVMRVDRYRLRRQQQRLSPEEYQAQVAASAARLNARRSSDPRIEYPSELPISSHRDELLKLIRQHQVIVVCGETGSGKSTQLPKICLEAGLGRSAMIGHTQPRRLAARSIADRLADELDVPLGSTVGYQIRFGDVTGDQTLIKLMTDGILLAETQSDRFLDSYDAIIIDEAHERSLNIDFLLGYLHRLRDKRRDLKIIITSATIDAERFAEHFGGTDGPAPIVTVEGRGFPVEIRYLPWEEVNTDEERSFDLSRHVIAGIEAASRSESGDMLVFLPTERDIREVSHRVAGHYRRLGLSERVELLPLYARLPQKEQQRIFHPDGQRRRIVFATNVAESSLTVPGIRCVIDSGTARLSRFSPRSKIQRLPVEEISRASADQRAGRCGRVAPGTCVRLYSVDDYESRDAFTTPEIRRTNLASVVLQTKTLRLGRLEDFPLLDPPRPESIRQGVQTLRELGAIDEQHELTDVGWKLGRLPVDPRVGRIILAADELGVLSEVLPIAAGLEIQDPRDRPPDRRQAADEAHAAFADPQSDFLSFLRLWRHYEQLRSQHSRSKLQRLLRKQFLSPTRMREWSDVYRQLREMAQTSLGERKRRAKRHVGKIRYADDSDQVVDDDRYAAIHQSLIAGLLSSVALLGERNEYKGAGGLKLFLWPGSGVFSARPKWVVAAELVETGKQYARTVARIQPAWIEQMGQHLLKRSHQDPHWSDKSNGAFCYEYGTLFGLPVYSRRRVALPPIDPITARDLLIERGLTHQGLRTSARFVRHNRGVRAAMESMAAKTRRRDLVVDHHVVNQFYQSRLPDDVCDRARLEKLDRSMSVPDWSKRLTDSEQVSHWLHQPPPATGSDTLYMRPDDLIDVVTETLSNEQFPDELQVGQSRLPLKYRFEPGSDRDGINVTIHQAAISQVSEDRLGWLVPGLLHQKVTAMIKALPKRIRRNLVPAADVAREITGELGEQFGQTPFMSAVLEAMSRHAECPITVDDFNWEKLDESLRFLITVVDDKGKTLAESRQLEDVRRHAKVGPAKSADRQQSETAFSDQPTKSFPVEEVPEQVVQNLGGVQVAQFPGLVDRGDAVSVQLFADLQSATTSHRNGLIRLYSIAERKELRSQVRWLPDLEQAKVRLTGAISGGDIEDALVDLLARIAFVDGEKSLARRQEDFEARRSDRGRRIAEATQEVASWIGDFASQYFAARSAIEALGARDGAKDLVSDVRQQVDWLLTDSFMSITPWSWLKHYPRYFAGIAYRLDKFRSGSSSRDRESMTSVQALFDQWMASLPEARRDPPSTVESEIRWMLEELRVSLFAQPLGTSVKVSVRRCEKLLGK